MRIATTVLLSLALGCSAAADRGAIPGALPGSNDPAGNQGIEGAPSNGVPASELPEDGDVGGDPTECRNVDVLFVIDDSGSMADNQKSLIASFPGFVDGIRKNLRYAKSVHVGVVTTDSYWGNAPGCGEIGSLITQTSGPKSSARNCAPFSSGARFLDQSEPDLAAKFACVAQVGAGGDSDERPMRALLNAVDPKTNAIGACNAGFSRLDSLLVVVVVTDEDDVPDGCDGSGACDSHGSGGTPDDWYKAVVAAKGGHAENVVVLSLIGLKGDNACGAVPAAKLMSFTRRFGKNGFLGDVCAADYSGFFNGALPVISDACKGYVRPK